MVEKFKYGLSVTLFLLYAFELYRFQIQDNIHAGVSAVIFLLCLFQVRNLGGKSAK